MRLLVPTLLVALAAALVGAGPAGAADRVVERGIVQSIDPTVVVLRALDGTDLALRLGPATRLRLNGRAATLADIRPGLVAEVVTAGTGPAAVLRAFGDIGRPSIRGVVLRNTPRGMLLRRPSGRSVRVALGARTAVWRAGRRVRPGLLRPGMHVDVYRAPGGVARVIVVRTAAS